MSPVVAYMLGLFTTLLIIAPFYVFSMYFNTVSDGYLIAFCKQATTYPYT